MLNKKSLVLAIACTSTLSFANTWLYAQESTEVLEEVIVVTNRIPIPLKQIATSVSVIDKADIEAHGNFSLADVLRQTTAVGVSSYGGIGSLSSIRIRGEESFRTLTLFNGLKLSDPSAPQVATSFEHILSSGIGRVEVLRGPQGLSYGADAGGVISISSAATEAGLNFGVDAQAGSRGAEQLGTTVSAANEKIDFFLSASKFKNDGYNIKASDTSLKDDDGYENSSYNSRLAYQATEALELELVLRKAEGETDYDGCYSGFDLVDDCLSIYQQDAGRIAANYEADSFSHSLAYSNTRTDRDDLAESISAFSSQGELTRWEYVGSATNLPGFDLIFGIDLEEEENGALSRDNKGYYIEYLSDFSDNFFVTAGIRRDDNEDFGDYDSARISFAYLFDLDGASLKLKASYGTGFRAPSLFEIDYNASSWAFPPASTTVLSEENSEGIEFGVEYLADSGLRIEVISFDQKVQDAIYFDLAAYSGYLQDVGNSTSDGLELIAEIPITAQLSLSGNITFNDTQRPNGLQRLRRPEQLNNLGLRYVSTSQKLKINAFYRASKDAIDEVFGSPAKLDDFELVDITASYRLSDFLEIYARIENLQNEEYQQVSGFFSPERASYVGIRVNF